MIKLHDRENTEWRIPVLNVKYKWEQIDYIVQQVIIQIIK